MWTSAGRTARNWALVLGWLLAAPLDGQAQASAKHDTFTAKTVNMSVGAGAEREDRRLPLVD